MLSTNAQLSSHLRSYSLHIHTVLQALVELQVLQYLSEMDPGNESNCIHITVSYRQDFKSTVYGTVYGITVRYKYDFLP